jgi:hypothetical protein
MPSDLRPEELLKYRGSRNPRTKDRVPIFLRKYKEGEKFEMVSGPPKEFVYEKPVADLIESAKNPKELLSLQLRPKGSMVANIPLSKFKKTPEFGGGGGAGAGSTLTKLTESAQAVYARAKWNGSVDFTRDDLEKAYKESDVDATFSDIWGKLPGEWRDSCIAGANELFSLFGRKDYVFHRGSRWVKELSKHWEKLNAQDGRVFTNINKWSPADIWMISREGSRVDLTQSKSLVELNNILLTELGCTPMNKNPKDPTIVGVSLKFISGQSAHSSWYNLTDKRPIVTFESYTLNGQSGNSDFFGSKDAYLYFSVDGKAQFRTFEAGPSSWQGELKGKSANQGKISYGGIQDLLRFIGNGRYQLRDVRPLRSAIEKRDQSFLKEFHGYYLKYTKGAKLGYDEFAARVAGQDQGWVFSKFLCTEMIDLITRNKIEDSFVSGMVAYASSQSKLSGPFLKLE